jgi:hypothetical protein
VDEKLAARELLRELVRATAAPLAVLLDASGTVIASAGSRSPLGLAQHALTIAQGIFTMSSVTGIVPGPEYVTEVDHGPDARLLIAIVQSRYVLTLQRGTSDTTPNPAFVATARALEELL